MKHRFAPSLMCMNMLEMRAQSDVLNKRADFLHIDIMDGYFVKNITLSPMFIEQIRDIAVPPIDAHLMVENHNVQSRRRQSNKLPLRRISAKKPFSLGFMSTNRNQRYG